VGVNEDVLTHFNRVSVYEVASVLGMEVTAANKSSTITPHDRIKDLTFLKSPFVRREGYYAAPLPKPIIYREVQWTRKLHEFDTEIMQQKIDTAAMFMAHHGREDFETFINQLESKGIHTHVNFNTWEQDIRDKQEDSSIEYAQESDDGWDMVDYIFDPDDTDFNEDDWNFIGRVEE